MNTTIEYKTIDQLEKERLEVARLVKELSKQETRLAIEIILRKRK